MRSRRREFEGETWERGGRPRPRRPARYTPTGLGAVPDYRRGRGIGARRGEWRWRGHAPGAAEGYGWEFRGGVPRGEHETWPEVFPARGLPGARLLEEMRSHGLPEDRERFEAEGGWTPGARPPGPRGRPLPRAPRRRGARRREYPEPYRRGAPGRRRYRGGRARAEPAGGYDVAYGGRRRAAGDRGVEPAGRRGQVLRYGDEYAHRRRHRGRMGE